MRRLLVWLSSASWLVWAYPTDSMAPTIVSRAEEAKEDPSLNDFRRRFDMGITILGDYLYIVGGNISRKVDDNNTVEAINATLSLDLTQDWEPATVELNSFAADVGPPPVWGHGLWADDKGDQVLLWGGSDIAPYDEGARTRKLWVLNPDNSGGGDWDITDAGSGIKRTTRGGYVTCGGKGYLLGGRGDVNTDQEAFEDEEAVTVPGLITYEFGDQVWKNESKSLWTDDGSWLRGQGVCVELPDRSPKVFFLGGQTGLDESKQLDFTTIHYWDPEQDEWFEQETVGKAPEPRLDSCAVGVSGPNGTYDIFMYSGWGGTFDDGSVLDDVWVLSLPAFRWFNISPDRAQARYAHRCVRVGSQMVVVGGGNKRKWWDSVDTFDRGIGILDLNTVSWKTGYEAKSDEYRGPDMIRAWYDEHGYDTAIWSNDEAKKAFSRPDDGPSNPSSTPSPGDGSSSNSSNTAAIAGGTVGGVAGLALIGLAAWFLLRRRRRRRTAVTKDPAHHGHDHGYDHGPVALAEADSTAYNRTPVSMAEADSKVSSSAPGGMVKTTYPKEMEGTAGPRAAELP